MWGYVDVRDVAQACASAIESHSIAHDAFFITAEDTFSDVPSLELITRGYPEVREISNDYLAETHKSLYDISKAKKLLGYYPQYRWRDIID